MQVGGAVALSLVLAWTVSGIVFVVSLDRVERVGEDGILGVHLLLCLLDELV